jgi:hypothetical protein
VRAWRSFKSSLCTLFTATLSCCFRRGESVYRRLEKLRAEVERLRSDASASDARPIEIQTRAEVLIMKATALSDEAVGLSNGEEAVRLSAAATQLLQTLENLNPAWQSGNPPVAGPSASLIRDEHGLGLAGDLSRLAAKVEDFRTWANGPAVTAYEMKERRGLLVEKLGLLWGRARSANDQDQVLALSERLGKAAVVKGRMGMQSGKPVASAPRRQKSL